VDDGDDLGRRRLVHGGGWRAGGSRGNVGAALACWFIAGKGKMEGEMVMEAEGLAARRWQRRGRTAGGSGRSGIAGVGVGGAYRGRWESYWRRGSRWRCSADQRRQAWEREVR